MINTWTKWLLAAMLENVVHAGVARRRHPA